MKLESQMVKASHMRTWVLYAFSESLQLSNLDNPHPGSEWSVEGFDSVSHVLNPPFNLFSGLREAQVCRLGHC